jgi:hypothetical protein
MIPIFFRFAKMCLCQVNLLSRCSPRYLTSSSWELHTVYMGGGGGSCFSSCSEFYLHRLGFVGFHSPFFLHQFWIASRSVCSFCEGVQQVAGLVTTEMRSTSRYIATDVCRISLMWEVLTRQSHNFRIISESLTRYTWTTSNMQKSDGFWRWCVTLRINGFLV